MSFEELIPLLIAAAYLIFRAVGANKKKQEELSRRRAQQAYPESDNDYYSASGGKDPHQVLLDMLGIERELPPHAGKTTPLQAPADPGNTEAELYPAYNLQPAATSDSLQSAKILEKMREESFRGGFKEPEEEPSIWDEEDFDMRKAVIYSEILRPKHTG